VNTGWYKHYEKAGRSDSMGAQWFVYYTVKEKLFTVYNNLNAHNADNRSCLSINRREVGLHNRRKGRENFCGLLTTWNPSYTDFPNDTWMLDWNAKRIDVY